MNPELERAREIFLHAVGRLPADQWDAYAEEASGGDAALTDRVRQLLRAHADAASFLESPVGHAAATVMYASAGEAAGAMVGPYKLLEQIGEGGMGDVWMAEQSEPIQRRVAVKVIKAGTDSKQVLARFDAERQALALMEHPNIARVLDAGATATGRPYFVMELVKGTPITKFCDEKKLNVRERLELFGDVCRAVQHAHQKGIIHRDIKPSNVLVAPYDGKPVVKVIDFGVAKATGQKLTDATLFTGYGAVVGTPEYMSPEQAEVNNQDIDTRSDIYSLGVLLFELLTGSTPLTKKRVKEAAFLEVLRVIREEESPKPSTRLSSTEELPSISALRHTEPAKLTKLVRGELDWIVMKALEKDRNRRYETANGFAMDVQRYLADEPVLACPPSAGYRLRKFVRRNNAGLGVAALVLFFLMLLGSGVGWAMHDRAARQANVAGQVESFLAEADRLEGEQKWPEALAAARRAEAAAAGGQADAATAQRIHQRLKDLDFIDRLERIRIQGDLDHARTDRAFARAFREHGVDVDALAVATSIDRLKARPALAIPLAAALDEWVLARRNMSTVDEAAWKRLVAVARGIDPEPMRDRIRETRGQPVAEVQDELRRLVASIDVQAQHPATLALLSRLDGVRYSEAALRLLREAQHRHPGDVWLNFELAGTLARHKDHEGAIRFYTAAVSIRPNSAAAHNNLGNILNSQNRLDEAIHYCRKAIELDPKLAAPHTNLGIALENQKKYGEAIAAHRKAIDLNPQLASAYSNLGITLRAQNKLAEAIDAYCKAIDLDPKDALAHNNLGVALLNQNKLAEASDAFRKALELNPQLASAYSNLGITLRAQNKLAEASDAFRKAIELDPKDATAHFMLGHSLYRLGKFEEAIPALCKAIELDPKNANAYSNLGGALGARGKLDEAIVACRKAIELDPKHAEASQDLGNFLSSKAWAVIDPASARRQALSLANEAVERAANSFWAWQHVGWVHYRTGDWRSSIKALERSCKLQRGGSGDAGQWIVLALAHARFAAQEDLPEKEREHHKAEARRWYDQADKQIDSWWRVRPGYDVGQAIWDFRAEARELLGVGKKKD